MSKMKCHEKCGACCIGLSISSALPGMAGGKSAGCRCVNLNDDLKCTVYERRPAVCREFSPAIEFCGASHDDALRLIAEIESVTSPDKSASSR